MPILILYCGFYLSGLLIARWLTLPRQALVSGIATTVSACVAALTLWLITVAGFVEPWLSIALAGTVGLPALMMGLGLLAGAWIRYSANVLLPGLAAASPVVIAVLLTLTS
ncbi:hypothetical protein MWU54_15600 [Marivita sp. S6314]|uniref:hypothetical protein n=1 Tax=Marivita sp. S6314 TaxID=2926406 RepID=UPI001FF11500|nr:hypothetical protein [Marivita sp. S6314]MCK0151467.1 hypothetical protein [Marivita sp. S6314]